MVEPDRTVEMTSGVDLELVFRGTPRTARAFNVADEFGLVVQDLDPEAALDVLAGDPSAASTWASLRKVLSELADADCNAAETMDYLATTKCGFTADEWADATNGHAETVRRNARNAAENLRETIRDAE